MKRAVLTRSFVLALCAGLALSACSAKPDAPGGVRAKAMEDSEFVRLCGTGTAEQIRQALKDGANPKARDEDGYTPLHGAADNPNVNLPVIQALLNAGADPNAEDEDGVTPLMRAANAANLPVVQALLAAGADPNAKDMNSTTPLLNAASTPNSTPEMVDMLLKAGANPNAWGDYDCQTVLMRAAYFGKPRIVAMLLEAGADKNDKDDKGHDALWHARHPAEDVSKKDQAEIIRLLEGGGAKKPAARRR